MHTHLQNTHSTPPTIFEKLRDNRLARVIAATAALYAIGEISARVGSGESLKDSTTAFVNKLNPKSGSNINPNGSIL